MKICYIDESGGFEAEASSPEATPLMVIAGLVVDHAEVPAITAEYLKLKQTYYPGAVGRPSHILDYVLAEVKATDLRRDLRSNRRDNRRHAIGFFGQGGRGS